MTDSDGYEEPILTRREALKGGSAAAVAAGAALYSDWLVQAVKAQTTEPRIQLGQDWVIDDDPGGNGSFVVEHTPNTNEYAFGDDGTLTLPTISSSEAEFTNETLVSVYLSSDQNINSSTVTTVELDTFDPDSTQGDVRDEFDTTAFEFSPDRTGWYLVVSQITYSSGADGDRIITDFRRKSDDTPIARNQVNRGGTNASTPPLLSILLLDSSESYELTAFNDNSSDTLGSGARSTYLKIRSVFA